MPTTSDAPVHVLSLLKGLSRGGAESLVLTAARHRTRDEVAHRVGYISAAHDDLVGELEAEGVAVTCFAPRSALHPRWLWRLRRAMTGRDGHPAPTVVHAHSPVPAVGARLMARTIPRSSRPAVITTEHNTWDSHHRLTRAAEHATFGLDDAHLAVSDAARTSLPPKLAEKVEVVIQGVHLDTVLGAADREGVRAELGIGPDELVVGTIANLRPSKGYPDLLRAAQIVTAAAPNVRFVAAGQGPLEDELSELHRASGLGDRFMFLGYRPDAVRVLSGFDIFCLASLHEGLPVALMEAMVLGVPTVATRAGGMAELVTDGQEGHLVPPGRPDLLAEVLLATAADPAELHRLADAAAEKGRTLSIEASIRHTEALYRTLALDHPS